MACGQGTPSSKSLSFRNLYAELKAPSERSWDRVQCVPGDASMPEVSRSPIALSHSLLSEPFSLPTIVATYTDELLFLAIQVHVMSTAMPFRHAAVRADLLCAVGVPINHEEAAWSIWQHVVNSEVRQETPQTDMQVDILGTGPQTHS